jgi:hypothetical protein
MIIVVEIASEPAPARARNMTAPHSKLPLRRRNVNCDHTPSFRFQTPGSEIERPARAGGRVIFGRARNETAGSQGGWHHR